MGNGCACCFWGCTICAIRLICLIKSTDFCVDESDSILQVVEMKELLNCWEKFSYILGLTHLFIYISEVSTCNVIPPKGTMEAFIYLSTKVSGDSFGNNVIKEV